MTSGVTTEGWIFMLTSIGFVLWLTGYCFYRVLSKPSSAEQMHAPPTIDTHDEDT